MKSLKRAMALLVVLTFAITSVCSFSAFAEEATFSDVDASNSDYQAITSLVASGIINGYEDGTFKPENTITRAEFAKLLAVASAPTGYSFASTASKFPDVAADFWANPYIEYAVNSKAINGYDDGTFKPENQVTFGEAVKMIVCTLGYGPVTDTTLTPWFTGYINIANQIGLLKGASSLGENPGSRGLVAHLIYNMLDCEPLVQTGVDTNGNPVYTKAGSASITTGGSTFSDTKDNTSSDDGVLLGVFEYSLTGESLSKSKAIIDDKTYEIGNVSYESLKALVGYEVEFSYTSSSSKNTLKSVTKNTGFNTVITVEDWQIEDVSSTEMTYYVDENAEKANDETTLKFASDLYVVYNGSVVKPEDINNGFELKDRLDVESGNISFISNDSNDNTVEVAIIESYTTYFVNAPSTSKGITTIYDKNAVNTNLPELALDEDDITDIQKISTKGGTGSSATLTGITSKSVTSIALPYDKMENGKVRISTATVTGTVSEMTGDYEEIKIGSDYYEVSPYFDLLRDAGVTDIEFAVGDNAKFYLDYKGKIAFVEKNESGNPYGLLVQYAEGSGMDAAYSLRILNTSNKLVDYNLKSTVKVNGSSMSDENAISTLKASTLKYDASKEKFIAQPIRYALSTSNGATVITALEIVDSADLANGNIVPYYAKKAETNPYSSNRLSYTSSGYTFKNSSSNVFTMNSSTAVFVIPADITDTTKYKKSSSGYFSNNNAYYVEPYDVDGTNAKVVVCYLTSDQATTTTVSSSTSVVLVESINDVKNSDDSIVKKISYYVAGGSELKSAVSSDDADIIAKIESIKPGDLIKFVTDNGEISNIRMVYVGGTMVEGIENGTGYAKDGNINYIYRDGDNTGDMNYQAIRGTVYNLDEDSKTIQVIPYMVGDGEFSAEGWMPFSISDSTVYYKWNTKDSKFEIVSSGSVKSYSDFAESDPTKATQAITIVMQKKVKAVYILND